MRPIELASDAGGEFEKNETVSEFLQERGIGQRFRDPGDRNALGAMDNASGSLKASLYKMMDAQNTSKWIDLLPKAVEAHNSRNHSTIQAPQKSVESNEVLSHLLLKANSEKVRHNAQVSLKTKKGLEIRSPFRALIPDKRIRGLRRGFQARVSGKVFKVKSFCRMADKLRQKVEKSSY